jgi:transcriptional regulator with XRE-family HTH domain
MKLSQADLGKRMDFGRHYISMIERGTVPQPSRKFFDRLEFLERAMDAAENSSPGTRLAEPPARYAEESQSMGPPHLLPPGRFSLSKRAEKTPHEHYKDAIAMIHHLFEHHPEAFSAMMVSLRGIYETHKGTSE